MLSFNSAAASADEQINWRDSCHKQLLESGFWLSKPDWQDLPLLKAVLGNPFTSAMHLEQLAAIISRSL
jgi:hypothetical protein